MGVELIMDLVMIHFFHPAMGPPGTASEDEEVYRDGDVEARPMFFRNHGGSEVLDEIYTEGS